MGTGLLFILVKRLRNNELSTIYESGHLGGHHWKISLLKVGCKEKGINLLRDQCTYAFQQAMRVRFPLPALFLFIGLRGPFGKLTY
jgi:hypothetical protein